MITEADTCRKYVLPKLTQAGWDNDPHSFTEQKTFTDGRIVVTGQKIKRQKQKREDYLLRYTRDFMIAVIESKEANGHGIIEFDYLSGQEREISSFPTPDDLWARLRSSQNLGEELSSLLLTPYY